MARRKRKLVTPKGNLTRKAQLMIEAAEASVSTLDNKMFAEFYVHAMKQAAVHNNHNFLNFIEQLKQPPVSIEEFIDSDQFIGSTDLKLWPKACSSLRKSG